MTSPKTLSKTDIFDLFMSSKSWKPSNTHRLFVIAFIGLPGTGKSYISKKLSSLLDIPICNNDEIRRFLNELGYSGEAPAQDIVEFVAERRIGHLLINKTSHIIDADVVSFQEQVGQLVHKHDAKLYLIRIVAREEAVLKRLGDRRRVGSSFSRAGAGKYLERKKLHEKTPIGAVSMTIENNPESDVDGQLGALRKLLVHDGVI